MTALEIAQRFLGKDPSPERIAKAQALARRMRVPWEDVKQAIAEHADAAKKAVGTKS